VSQAPYNWVCTGSCLVCGSPVYGRVRKPGRRADGSSVGGELHMGGDLYPETPEAQRTCPPSCVHGVKPA